MWAKILASKLLRKTDIVKSVRYQPKPPRLFVEFKTGITERFFCDGKDRKRHGSRHNVTVGEDTNLRNDIPIHRQYELDILNRDEQRAEYHNLIYKEDWNTATVPEQRIAYHRFLLTLQETSTREDYYPPNQLMSDWAHLKAEKSARYMHNGQFYMYPSGMNINTPWRRVIEHYFQVTPELSDDALDLAMYKVCKSIKLDISTYEVRKKASIITGGSRAYNPVAYKAILERIGAVDSVIDLHPDIGHKALACAMMGLKYICPPTEKFHAAIEKGFLNDFGIVHEWLEDQHTHTVLSDNNFEKFEIDTAMYLVERSKMLMTFARSEERLKIANEYAPMRTYVVRKSRYRSPGFLFIW